MELFAVSESSLLAVVTTTARGLAIAKASTEGTRTDEVNPISQQYFPNK